MPASLIYRSPDPRWGGGLGSDLSALQIDLNFYTLFSAVQTLENNQAAHGAGIDYMVVNGNQLFVHLTDHRVIGPLTIPTANWHPKGAWTPGTNFASFDVVTNNGALYLVLMPHTSGATFSVNSTDGLGHNLYSLLLEQPASTLPSGGTIGQRLVKASGSPYVMKWESDFIRLALFVEGKPTPSERVMQYAVVDFMTLPVGLLGSVAYSNVVTSSAVSWTITKNGSAIGSIDFNGPSPVVVNSTFTAAIDFAPGDLIAIIAPTTPDVNQADISITLLATLTA